MMEQEMNDLEKRIADLESALKGMLEHCSCQGRGYRSWNNGEIVKRCQSLTCIKAREMLNIPESDYVKSYYERQQKKDKKRKEWGDIEDDTLEISQQGLLDMAKELAKQVGAVDRFEMFKRFDNKEYSGLDVEASIAACKHLLGE